LELKFARKRYVDTKCLHMIITSVIMQPFISSLSPFTTCFGLNRPVPPPAYYTKRQHHNAGGGNEEQTRANITTTMGSTRKNNRLLPYKHPTKGQIHSLGKWMTP
jgi:hypothetical protein